MKKTESPSLSEIAEQMAINIRRTSVRPSIHGYRAQEYQERFHKSTKKGKLFIGGNRAGKTVAGAAEAVMRLTGTHKWRPNLPIPCRGRALGVDYEQGIKKIILPEIAKWIPPSSLINGSWEDSYSSGERMLRLANGSVCDFLSYEQDVAKSAGTSRHFVWFDEEPPEDIFNENMARLIDTKGDYWLTMTPLIDMSWTEERLYNPGLAGNPNLEVFEVDTAQNSYVSQSEMAILLDGMTEDQIRARQSGKFIGHGQNIYKNLIKPEAFIDPIVKTDEWPAFRQAHLHFGMLDHGYTNPTAFYLGAADGDGNVIIYDEYYHPGRVVEENALAILSRIRELRLTDKLQYIVADPSIRNSTPLTGMSVHQAYSEFGLYLALGNNDVEAGINRVSSRFKHGKLFITRDCEKLIWELSRYRWDKYQSQKIGSKRNLKETPLKKDDHAVDALRYGIMSTPALPGEIESKFGNELRLPVGIENGEWKDDELITHLGVVRGERNLVDSTLGDEW